MDKSINDAIGRDISIESVEADRSIGVNGGDGTISTITDGEVTDRSIGDIAGNRTMDEDGADKSIGDVGGDGANHERGPDSGYHTRLPPTPPHVRLFREAQEKFKSPIISQAEGVFIHDLYNAKGESVPIGGTLYLRVKQEPHTGIFIDWLSDEGIREGIICPSFLKRTTLIRYRPDKPKSPVKGNLVDIENDEVPVDDDANLLEHSFEVGHSMSYRPRKRKISDHLEDFKYPAVDTSGADVHAVFFPTQSFSTQDSHEDLLSNTPSASWDAEKRLQPPVNPFDWASLDDVENVEVLERYGFTFNIGRLKCIETGSVKLGWPSLKLFIKPNIVLPTLHFHVGGCYRDFYDNMVAQVDVQPQKPSKDGGESRVLIVGQNHALQAHTVRQATPKRLTKSLHNPTNAVFHTFSQVTNVAQGIVGKVDKAIHPGAGPKVHYQHVNARPTPDWNDFLSQMDAALPTTPSQPPKATDKDLKATLDHSVSTSSDAPFIPVGVQHDVEEGYEMYSPIPPRPEVVELPIIELKEYVTWFDAEGRLEMPIASFQEQVSRRTMTSGCRSHAWPMLLGVDDPCHSTLEKAVNRRRLACDYLALKRQWLEYSPRQLENWPQLKEVLQLVERDMPRTDRELEPFQFHLGAPLTRLRHILLTYFVVDPEVGYMQGMNDLMAVLVLLYLRNYDSEAKQLGHSLWDPNSPLDVDQVMLLDDEQKLSLDRYAVSMEITRNIRDFHNLGKRCTQALAFQFSNNYHLDSDGSDAPKPPADNPYEFDFDTEEAMLTESLIFWCFVATMQRMRGYFLPEQQLIVPQLRIWHELLAIVDPQLSQHLEKHLGNGPHQIFRYHLTNFKRDVKDYQDAMAFSEVVMSGYPCPNFVVLVSMAIFVVRRQRLLSLKETRALETEMERMRGTIVPRPAIAMAHAIYDQLRASVNELSPTLTDYFGISRE